MWVCLLADYLVLPLLPPLRVIWDDFLDSEISELELTEMNVKL